MIVSLASAVTGCRSVQARSPLPLITQDGAMVPLKVLYSAPDAGIQRALREVITDQAEFERLWDEVHGGATPTPIPPKVGFTREMVIVASMGVQAAVGSHIAIASVRDQSGIREVTVEMRPFPCSIGWPSVTYPVTIVSVPSTSFTVAFQDRIVRTQC